jgi:hypothetical protein
LKYSVPKSASNKRSVVLKAHIALGKTQYTSEEVLNTRHPQFNLDGIFRVVDSFLPLVITVQRDGKFLGEVHVSLDILNNGLLQDEWFHLLDHSRKHGRGFIRLLLMYDYSRTTSIMGLFAKDQKLPGDIEVEEKRKKEPSWITRIKDDQEAVDIRQWQRIIFRFLKAIDPLVEFFEDLHALVIWKNPAASLLVFFAWTVLCLYDYVLPILPFYMAFRIVRQYPPIIYALESISDAPPPERVSITQRMKIMEVLRNTQDLLEVICDYLERAQGAAAWVVPARSLRTLFILMLVGILSLFVEPNVLFLLLGIYLFTIHALMERFAKFRYTFGPWLTFISDVPTIEEREHPRPPVFAAPVPPPKAGVDDVALLAPSAPAAAVAEHKKDVPYP